MALQLQGRPAGFPRRQVLAILSIVVSLAVIWRTAGPAWSSLHVDWEGGGATQLVLEGIPPQQRREYPSGAAVIVETRTTAPNLIPLMLHFSSVLGPNWPVVLFTPEGTWSPPPASAALHRALAADRIRIRHLPANVTDFTTPTAVSLFLADEWLWAQLEHAPRVLMFQLDSVLCANANGSVDDFAHWDLVGAPINERYGIGYNGGLSLRNPRLMREIARLHGPEFKRANAVPISENKLPNHERYEDQWFYSRALALGANLPDQEVAKGFAVETIYHERPLGYHQPMRWQTGSKEDILAYCPEVAMLEGRAASFG